MNTVVFDDSRYPLIVIRFHESSSEEDFVEHLRLLDLNLKRTFEARTKTALIYDATLGQGSSLRIRKLQADWMKANADVVRLGCVGISFVITSALVRGGLTAGLWLADIAAPYEVVATVGEAEAFCKKKLAQAGVALPGVPLTPAQSR